MVYGDKISVRMVPEQNLMHVEKNLLKNVDQLVINQLLASC
jgi:hypothetical protein